MLIPPLRQALLVRRNASILSHMNFRFNWKHILFHFLGLWFFSYGFMVLSYLQNVEVAEIVRLSTDKIQIKSAQSLSKIVVSMAIAFVIGYLIALVISFIVSNNFIGSWINTLIAFIVFFVLMKLDLTGWAVVKEVFLFPGSFFNGWKFYLLNGTILIGFGIFFIFGIKFFYNNPRIGKSSKSPQYA